MMNATPFLDVVGVMMVQLLVWASVCRVEMKGLSTNLEMHQSTSARRGDGSLWNVQVQCI